MPDYEILRTDLETGISDISYILTRVTEEIVISDMKRLNRVSEKDGTMNHYSYRECKDVMVSG